MVRKITVLFLFLLIAVGHSYAAEFTASVSKNRISMGESLQLKLELKDAKAKSRPDVSAIENDFSIYGQQQSSSTSIINGSVSTSTSWNYVLMPKREGEQTIPKIQLKTSKGVLESQLVTISVTRAATHINAGESGKSDGVTITASVSKRNPYKNEPIIYTVQLRSSTDLANVNLGELSVKDAIVERINEPKIGNFIENGVAVRVAEIKYRVTPLKSGEISIPPLVIQGEIPVPAVSSGDLLDHDFDLFERLRRFGNFGSLAISRREPFAVGTKPITLNVKPAKAAVTPWLPAQSLTISENWNDEQNFRVGEPITRRFTIVGKGITSKQLPSLQEQLSKNRNFKVYADQPRFGDDTSDGVPTSWREETYTLIPKQSGQITLPQISVAWWDVENDKEMQANVPELQLTIAPGVASNTKQVETVPESSEIHNKKTAKVATAQHSHLLLAVLAVLIGLLLMALFWVINLRLKVTQLKKVGPVIAQTPAKPEAKLTSCKEITKATSAKELQSMLQSYAHCHWNLPKNSSLDTVFAAAKQKAPSLSVQDVNLATKSIQGSLYANQQIDLELVKKTCVDIIKQTEKQVKNRRVEREKLPILNP
ncbi:MAG: BatD family protein [Pseudomonadota bacterium]